MGMLTGPVDFDSFVRILNRPDGFRSAGSFDEFVRGFQVFDKEQTGYITAGELKYGDLSYDYDIDH
jgi:calmodulin